MTVAEVKALSTNTPTFFQNNDAADLVLNKHERVLWETYDSGKASMPDQALYNLTYHYSFKLDRDWLEKNKFAVYKDILSTYGEPTSKIAPTENKYEGFQIVYGGPKQKMANAPDGYWMKFLNACKAEIGGGSAVLNKNVGYLMNMYLLFDEAYNEVKALCPTALDKEYPAFLKDRLQPRVQFGVGEGFSMSTTCPAAAKWTRLQTLRKNK